MTVTHLDDFTGLAAGSSVNGRTVSPTNSNSASWLVSNNALTNFKGETGGDQLIVNVDTDSSAAGASFDSGLTDCSVAGTVNSLVTNFSEPALFARGDSGARPSNMYTFRLRHWNSDVQIRRRSAGAYTDLANIASGAFAAGTIWKLEVSGTGATVSVKVYKNGVRFDSYAGDSSASRLTSGTRVGFDDTSGGKTVWDDFTVDDLAAGGATGAIPTALFRKSMQHMIMR